MTKIRGFTLIEILIVLIILSIVASVAVIKIGFSQNKQIEFLAEQFVQAFTLAQEQAMLQPTVMGMKLTDHSYQFDAYRAAADQKKSAWEPLKEALLSKQTVPDFIEFYLQQEEKQVRITHAEKPQIIISTTGEMTPFILYIAEKGHQPRFKIIGEANGHIRLLSL